MEALEIQHDATTSLRTLCAALAPGIGERFGREVQDDDDEWCWATIYFAGLGGDNVPDVESTTHAATRVRVRGNRAILSTRLTHRYTEGRPRTVVARALLLRGSDGVWSLATLWPLLGLWAVLDGKPLTDAQLGRMYAEDVSEGRRDAAERARRQAVLDAATVGSTVAEPCRPTMRADPLGDVMANGDDLSRRPLDHPEADLIATGLLHNCLAIETAGPLPARFDVETSRLHVQVRDGRVLAESVRKLPEDDVVLVPGLVAHLEPSRLVVQTPANFPVGTTPHLIAEPDGPGYHDADKSRDELYGGRRGR